MLAECKNCYPDKEMTRHRVVWLGGEKESYYSLRCSRCGLTRLLPKWEMPELKRLESEYKG